MQVSPILQNLSVENFETLCNHATELHYAGDEIIFEEGDSASEFFFVKSGSVSIYIHKYHRTENISVIHDGDCFGEMAILNNTRRTASAKTLQDTTLLCLDIQTFRSILNKYPDIEEKISSLIAKRNEELVLKESILDSSGFNDDHVHLSIKGDPSMRETVFNRERYESIVDKILPELIPNIESMLLERNVFRINLKSPIGDQ